MKQSLIRQALKYFRVFTLWATMSFFPLLALSDSNQPIHAEQRTTQLVNAGTEVAVERLCRQATEDNFKNLPPDEKDEDSYQAYVKSESPLLEDRKLGLVIQTAKAESQIQVLKPELPEASLFDYFVAAAHGSWQSSSKGLDFKTWSRTLIKAGINSNPVTIALVSPGACEGKTPTCAKALRRIAEIMSPKIFNVHGVVSVSDLLSQVWAQPVYNVFIPKIALFLHSRIGAAESGIFSGEQRLFDDVLEIAQGLTENGKPVSSARAEELTYNVLGLYATRGAAADAFIYMNQSPNQLAFLALAVVSSQISYLDALTTPHGQPYSLPSLFRTRCDYTRPYHFWLSAYLSHRLKNEGYDEPGIFMAVHSLEVNYERFAKVSTKKSLALVATDLDHNHDASYLIETEKNIIYNDTGSAWELRKCQTSSHPIGASLIDDGLLRMQSARAEPKLNKRRATTFEKLALSYLNVQESAFLRWWNYIQPNANIDYRPGDCL